ncbi:MAG TPA: type IV secretion system DNA-binding domain-containing protein, partial [Candidatus Absconditabacterales bacterium]|nr:type IV secretion system DNA-binding domain-containing protein [Candidatus Absconditabacterales bacterium]
MITSKECKDLLQKQFQKDFSQKQNVSQLMTKSRGENRSDCFSYFGNIGNINSYLENIQNNEYMISRGITESDANRAKTIEKQAHASAKVNDNNPSSFGGIKVAGMFLLYLFLSVIIIRIFSRLMRYVLRRGYAFLNNHRMVYMKVLVPRGDSKIDREQAKELAKDMKEKIGRMSQVYLNFHKIGRLSMKDKIMYRIFRKPRIVLMYHYEGGILNFIVGCFPEYQKILEGAIGAQFADSALEVVKRPNIFRKKYHKVMPLQSEKSSIYTIRLYKRMMDDPINNIIDSMNNISKSDTATVIMTIKPLSDKWNEKAKRQVDRLYKNLDLRPSGFFPAIWYGIKTFFKLLFHGEIPVKQKEENISMVRMVKAKEETINDMAEEIGTVAFESGLILVTSSDHEDKLKNNIQNLVSSYNVYTDQYGNELEQLGNRATIFGFLARPLWRIAASYNLTNLFYNSNTFTLNELTSLYHFPDYTYNRSNIIERMQYKILPAPSNLPSFRDGKESGFIMSGIVAEKYKGGKLSEILKEYKDHRAVGSRKVIEEKLVPIENFKQNELAGKEIEEKDGKKFVKVEEEKEIYGYKIYKDGVLLGTNIYRNTYSPVYMKRNDRTRHHYCIGKSGTGKSVFLQTLARQDIWNGDGVCVIDPHGDLVEDMLEYIPKERAKDVIYFDAGDEERPMGLNLYEID